MAYSFSELKQKIEEALNWLSHEFSTIRTGRATPSILDSVQVESYGSKMPINQVGSISVEDARTLRISPWDQSQIRAIEKAIVDANLGLSVTPDDKGVRAIFPELSAERREALIKVAGEKTEKAKISIRSARDDVWEDIQKKQKAGELSEDDKFRLKEEMQKLVDEANKKLEEKLDKKEAEIRS